ncbi:hypothetical protein C475_11184 [Halosimplex carlsbadense 2-9-1]|uniref:Uncharacterized protein n=1 Tax=Halosimplex carlsbadense 2-9-1 TaxID=797114 RepID=M0CPE8_9EURY|nr:hypothetical protein [Halosimplex carlsbadense]ELZ25106.1 hypothetical protein C475_11184 [Halosimplex carlsbadense 2-9-1]
MSHTDIDEISEEIKELDQEKQQELTKTVSEDRLSKYLELRGEFRDRLEDNDLTNTMPREGPVADYCSEHPDDPLCKRVQGSSPPRTVQDSMEAYREARAEYMDELRENNLLDLEARFGQADADTGGGAGAAGEFSPGMGISYGDVLGAVRDVREAVEKAEPLVREIEGWFGTAGPGAGANASAGASAGRSPGYRGAAGTSQHGATYQDVFRALQDVRDAIQRTEPLVREIEGLFGASGGGFAASGGAGGYGQQSQFGQQSPYGQAGMAADPYAMGLLGDVADTVSDVKDAVDTVTDTVNTVTGRGVDSVSDLFGDSGGTWGGGRGRYPRRGGVGGPRFGMTNRATPAAAHGGRASGGPGAPAYGTQVTFDDVLGAVEDVKDAVEKAEPVVREIQRWFSMGGPSMSGQPMGAGAGGYGAAIPAGQQQMGSGGGPRQYTPLPDGPFPQFPPVDWPPWPNQPQIPLGPPIVNPPAPWTESGSNRN